MPKHIAILLLLVGGCAAACQPQRVIVQPVEGAPAADVTVCDSEPHLCEGEVVDDV